MVDLQKELQAFASRFFTNTALDDFDPSTSVKRSTEERWGFLFICLTTRDVQFEVVQSMDTSSSVMEIERFVLVGVSPPLSGKGNQFRCNGKRASPEHPSMESPVKR